MSLHDAGKFYLKLNEHIAKHLKEDNAKESDQSEYTRPSPVLTTSKATSPVKGKNEKETGHRTPASAEAASAVGRR